MLALLIVTLPGCGASGTSTQHTTSTQQVEFRLLGLTTHVPAAITLGCAKVAKTYVGRVYCPTVAPVGPVKVSASPLNPHTPSRRHLAYLLDMTSRSLMSLHGESIAAAGGHWTIAGGTDPSLPSLVDPNATNARDRPKHSTATIDSQPVDVYLMEPYLDGGGYYGDHAVVAWKRAGVTYQVSVHGHANKPRALAIAQSIIDQQRAATTP